MLKNLLLFLLLGAFVAVTGVYCGVWTIPGLEGLPQRRSVGAEKEVAPRQAARPSSTRSEERPPGYYRTAPDSASGNRAAQLKDGARAINGSR